MVTGLERFDRSLSPGVTCRSCDAERAALANALKHIAVHSLRRNVSTIMDCIQLFGEQVGATKGGLVEGPLFLRAVARGKRYRSVAPLCHGLRRA